MTPEALAKIRGWIREKKVVEVPAVMPESPKEVVESPTTSDVGEVKGVPSDLEPDKIKVLRNEIILGNCIEVLKRIPDNTFTAVVTDPPYFLNFMGKEWDAAPEDVGNEIADQMRYFQAWSEAWAKEVLRVLKPGGHLLSFGSTRTSHRMVCGIEEAGFQIRDRMSYFCEKQEEFGWIYGAGFPKSLNIGKAMEKEIIGAIERTGIEFTGWETE